MIKIGQFIESIDSLYKEAFIPAPTQAEQQLEPLYQQLDQLMQSSPPEVQQQLQQQMQEIEQLPPDQQVQAIEQLLQQAQQQPPPPQQPQEEPAQQDPNEAQLDKTLDDTKVTVSVRQLLDLTSGGKATQSQLKTKQMVDAHNQKLKSIAAKEEQQAIQQQEQEAAQAQDQGMMSGGIY